MKRGRFLSLCVLVALVLGGCKGPEGPVGPAGPRSGGSADLSDPSIMPKVIYTYPTAHSQGPYTLFAFSGTASLQFRFNKYMEVGTIRRVIEFRWEGGKIELDTSRMQTVGGDVYIVAPITWTSTLRRWGIGNRYYFSVDSSAVDINGNHLSPSYRMSFVPEPFFRISAQSPNSGSTIPPTVASLYLTFNSPVDTSILSAIQLTPNRDIRFDISSYDSSTVYMNLLDGLEEGTEYTLIVNSAAHDIYGNTLPEAYRGTFATLPFQVTYAFPENGSSLNSLTNYIYIEFSDVLDPSTTGSAVHIRPPVDGTVYLPITSIYQLTPWGNLMPETVYTINIDTTLRSMRGSHLASPYTFSFTTPPFWVSTFPGDGNSGISRSIMVQAYAAGRIDTSTVRASFSMIDSIGSAVAGTFRLNYQSQAFYFSPDMVLQRNALYTIKISTGLSATGGWHLKSPYTATFRTSY